MTEVASSQQEPQVPESLEQESRASYEQSSQQRGPYESLWDLQSGSRAQESELNSKAYQISVGSDLGRMGSRQAAFRLKEPGHQTEFQAQSAQNESRYDGKGHEEEGLAGSGADLANSGLNDSEDWGLDSEVEVEVHHTEKAMELTEASKMDQPREQDSASDLQERSSCEPAIADSYSDTESLKPKQDSNEDQEAPLNDEQSNKALPLNSGPSGDGT